LEALPDLRRLGVTDERSRRAVLVAEQFADGLATAAELDDALDGAFAAWRQDIENNVLGMCRYAASVNLQNALQQITRPDLLGVPSQSTQAALLRCIFGNPFRPVCPRPKVPLASGTLVEWPELWITDLSVLSIAQAIYTERRFGDLPILADTLEEAGLSSIPCPNCYTDGKLIGFHRKLPCPYTCDKSGMVTNPILSHCRDGGTHCRGCWVVDLILGKE
jgi:hypothetical protein